MSFIRHDLDWEMYQKDPDHYSLLNSRLYEEYNRAYDNHMGDEFSSPPLFLKEDLEKCINHRADRLNRLVQLKAPETIRENEQRVLGDYIYKLKNNEFIVTKEEKEYAENFYKRENEFKFEKCWYEFDFEEKFKEYWNCEVD